MEKNSGVAQQVLKEQPKAYSTHCHSHSLSLSIKDANKQSRILNDVIAFSSDGDYDDFEQATFLSKLSVTRLTVRAIVFNKICKNVYR